MTDKKHPFYSYCNKITNCWDHNNCWDPVLLQYESMRINWVLFFKIPETKVKAHNPPGTLFPWSLQNHVDAIKNSSWLDTLHCLTGWTNLDTITAAYSCMYIPRSIWEVKLLRRILVAYYNKPKKDFLCWVKAQNTHKLVYKASNSYCVPWDKRIEAILLVLDVVPCIPTNPNERTIFIANPLRKH